MEWKRKVSKEQMHRQKLEDYQLELKNYFLDRLVDDFLTCGVRVVFLEREDGLFLWAGSEIGLEGEEEATPV